MVNRIRAINMYRPRIKRAKTVQLKQLVDFVADRTGLNAGEVLQVLLELQAAIVFFSRMGQGVKLEGLGTYLPKIGLDGTFDVEHRLDRGLKRLLNIGIFYGKILNRRNIGKTADELVGLWDVEHPDDPVE